MMRGDSTRRTFLGNTIKTLGAAVGLSLLPRAALASPGHVAGTRADGPAAPQYYTCCINCTNCNCSCGGNPDKARWYCTDTCGNHWCTSCQDKATTPNCYSGSFPSC